MLVFAAVLWVWSDERTLGKRFVTARKLVIKMFRWQEEPGTSYQGFIKALHKQKEKLFAKKQARKKKKNSKKQLAGPQIWLTLFWHVGLGLPWGWKTGPVDSSERAHMLEMLGILPENSMIVADAGFVGYDNWRAIEDAGHAFVIRVGANVKLLKKLGYARESEGRVYLWPDKARKKSQLPMVLRLITVHNGKHPMYLVTNVLSKKELSDRAAAEIYKSRWGIDTLHRKRKDSRPVVVSPYVLSSTGGGS